MGLIMTNSYDLGPSTRVTYAINTWVFVIHVLQMRRNRDFGALV